MMMPEATAPQQRRCPRAAGRLPEARTPVAHLPWVQVAPGVPYFLTEAGEPWTPIGQNDAITWPEFDGLFRRRDPEAADRYMAMLAAHGVTVVRLMLEYCHREHRYLENPVGRMVPAMVQLWDDIFTACERHGVRMLLTPYDTFWMWIRWAKHPYNVANGGPCPARSQLLTSPETRTAIKQRLAFATERWGGSGALFAWDIWNEIHSAHAGDCATHFQEFIADVGGTLRDLEVRLHGRAHPQTVSIFGPHLSSDPCIAEAIFRHPALDFASTHFYETGTIDNPRDTVSPAISTGGLTRLALAETDGRRPFFDSEHGPIHAFKDRHKSLPEPFDDEYFRHMQWAHFASGGAGGGMRWPNRHPHSLTAGMRRAQAALARFLPLIDWRRFRRRNLNEEVTLGAWWVVRFACGDAEQAIVWLLRTDRTAKHGMVLSEEREGAEVRIPAMRAGRYRVVFFDTKAGTIKSECESSHDEDGELRVRSCNFPGDVALAVRRLPENGR